ncbi:MAG: type II toxin-antitoxin system PemK/MazF family toxin [Sphingobacteriaceae bacterium]|nr:type II toxin-antitoxin system PemK/MazF family toxin [Sphingobacteriaceae bacterium]
MIQTNLLNDYHPSTLVCPITSKVNRDIELLRVHLKKGQLDKPSDILVDQIRAIDNRRFKKRLGTLTKEQIQTIKTNVRIVLDI